MRGGLPPLDYDTVAAEARTADYGGVKFLVAGLRSIVGFKRLSDRPRDRNDLLVCLGRSVRPGRPELAYA